MNTLFHSLLTTYILLVVIEIFSAGSASSFLNMNLVLAATIAAGIPVVLNTSSNTQDIDLPNWRTLFKILFLSLAAAVIVWFKARELGWISFVVAAAAGGLMALLLISARQGEEVAGEDSACR